MHLRPIPNFMTFWDDLSINQKKFILITHDIPENSNIRDVRVISEIKKLLDQDNLIWKSGNIPIYVQFQANPTACFQGFMDLIPLIDNIMNKRNLNDLERRSVCSQIEVLTDMFFSARPNFRQLSLNEQYLWKSTYLRIENYRSSLLASLDSTLLADNLITSVFQN